MAPTTLTGKQMKVGHRPGWSGDGDTAARQRERTVAVTEQMIQIESISDRIPPSLKDRLYGCFGVLVLGLGLGFPDFASGVHHFLQVAAVV
ncbi:hypothetical protein Hanom_Chr02g00173341 [Helianthus anomalus]